MPHGIRFDDRVAIVTGAGNGLGRDFALELGRRGAKVIVNDLGSSGSGVGQSASAADQVVAAIRDFGGAAIASHESAATRAGGRKIVEAALDSWGRVDLCIHSAGFVRNQRFEDLTDDDVDSLIDVHLKGSFYVGQPAYRAMRHNSYGRMLFIGSGSAMFGHAWQANYAAVKAALVGLSNVIAIEGSAYGIQSNVILPAAITRLADHMGTGFREIPDFVKSMESADFSASDGRLVPEFVSPLALYLVSEASTATHGIYSANSGRYARVGICAAQGWMAPAGTEAPSLEDIHAHFAMIDEMRNPSEPLTMFDEFSTVAATAASQGAQA